MKFLILGHTGFVGKNLYNFLSGKGHDVVGLSTDDCDLRNYQDFRDVMVNIGNVDVIYNLAANVGSVHYVTAYAADVISDNSLMAINLYKVVHELCPTATIVNPLSNCCYANGSTLQDEEEWLSGPVHPSVFSFGNFKRVLFYVSRCYEIQHNIKTVNLMFPGIYGPGDSTDPNKVHALNGMIIRMLETIKEEKPQFEIWGTGKPIREWIYIDDVCEVMAQASRLDSMTSPVNIAQGTGFAIAETGACIAKATEYTGELVFNTDYQDGAPIKILGTGRFEDLFEGYKFFDHEEGIRHTVEYYKGVLG